MKEFIMQETEEMKTFGSVWKRYEPVAVLVRCKDCKKRYGGQCPYTSSGDPYIDQDTEDDWFCAEGEPKDK